MRLGEILNVVQDDTSLRFRIGMIRGVISLIYKKTTQKIKEKIDGFLSRFSMDGELVRNERECFEKSIEKYNIKN